MPDVPDVPEVIESFLVEERTFAPSESFRDAADLNDPAIYAEAAADPQKFWAQVAKDSLDWFEPWHTVCDWKLPSVKWFEGGQLNASYNCLDRHVNNGHGDQVAYYWEGEPGDTRTITYADLLNDVCQLANALKALGVQRGDRVNIYLGMVPELSTALLACSRIGAAHSVVFGGFSSDSLRDRINDAGAKVLITADGSWRRGTVFPLKETADAAVAQCPTIERVLVLRRTEQEVPFTEGRDIWWHDLVPQQETICPPEIMEAEDLLFLLYTSGTTAKPKGIMHTTGGYLTQVAYTHKAIFDIKSDHDVYWCGADVGWVTGHSYVVYGPLMNRTTSVIYEGTPDFPDKDRLWQIIARYGVTIFYTAPTAIRSFMKWGDKYPAGHDLSSLRLIGSVGEPINPEAWIWYFTNIGASRCPIVDTWWQTETGAAMISPLPGITELKPGSATLALPGIGVDIFDESGKSVGIPGGGYLVLTTPWPAMLRGIWGDPDRYQETYWSRFPGFYFAGDGAKRDEDGYYWLLGRVDDVMLVSGHNISTAEVEHAIVSHPAVAEAAVVGRTDAVTGQAIAAFVILRAGQTPSEQLGEEIRNHVAQTIGPIAKPKTVLFTEDLPKTRSGKIMRRLLRDVSEHHTLGDTTTLADPSVVEAIAKSFLAASDRTGED